MRQNNQIECWFSNHARHVLARGSFASTDDLAAKIDAYGRVVPRDRPAFPLVVPHEVLVERHALIRVGMGGGARPFDL
jgi:hypothetical protein